jgi:threonine dehydrogenase-like Zn-dependent dehydrogenase
VTACAICGSDLHIYGGIIPSMKKGDVLGHENMGEVGEVGSENKKLKVGDRVVVPFTIACGECFFCRNGFYSGCERTNPDHEDAAKLWGNSPAGLFGLLASPRRLCRRPGRNICGCRTPMSVPSK